jgi:hypothetical protein
MAGGEMGERRRTYAEWFVWSGRNLASTLEIRHAAAEAATEAKAAGGDPAAAAKDAAQNRAGPGWARLAAPEVRSYAEWYDWARTTLSLSGEALHSAAAAAIAEIERGGDAASAAALVGQSAAGTPTALPSTPPQPQPASPMPVPHLSAPPPAQPLGYPPAPHVAAPPTAQPLGYPPATHVAAPPPAQPHGYPPAAAPAASPYGAPFAGQPPGPVEVPVWVAILLGFDGGISILIALYFGAAIFSAGTPVEQLYYGAIGGSGLVIFVCAFIALLGVILRARWARVMAIVAGVALFLSCVLPILFYYAFSLVIAGMCILVGLAVIVGAVTARRPAQRT